MASGFSGYKVFRKYIKHHHACLLTFSHLLSFWTTNETSVIAVSSLFAPYCLLLRFPAEKINNKNNVNYFDQGCNAE